jgi:hypothetical protein
MKVKYVLNGKSVSENDFLAGGDGIRQIIESRQFPGLQTDDEFMANRGTLSSQLGEQTESVVKAAKQNGYKPNLNDVYLPAMARFPGDPEAFVSHGSARGSVRRTMESRGWGCEGSVKVKARESEPASCRLADEIVEQEVLKLTLEDKNARKAGLKELKQHVIDKHGVKK